LLLGLILSWVSNPAFAGDNMAGQPVLTLTVPANGDTNFPLNGSFWLYGKNLDSWPQEVTIPTGYAGAEVPPWETNTELTDLWREPRRAQWRRNNGQRRLRTLTDGLEGISLVLVSSGLGVEIEVSTYGAVYRPPLRFTADGLPIERALDNVFDLLVVTPLERLEPDTEYALLANGSLSVFSTGQLDDTTAPDWGGIEDVKHLGERNTIYTLTSAGDDFSFPVRVELYRGQARSPRLRQFALVGSRPVTGRLSPLNRDCIFTRAVDVAGNYTDLFPCYPYPEPPEVELEEETMFGCNVAGVLPTRISGWLLILLGTMFSRRIVTRDMT
jgi:hypothetical protein